MRQLARRELFDLVWARPMTKLAADFGISDVALHKICRKHRIPVPGRGYWAKRAAGKPVRQARFREIQDADLEQVQINPSPVRSLPPEVLEARAQAKARRPARVEVTRAGALPMGGDDPRLMYLRQKLERAKPGKDGFLRVSGPRLPKVEISPPLIDRTMAIFEHLCREAELQGFAVSAKDGPMMIIAEGEALTIHVSEPTDSVRHEQTERETAALRKWEAEQERRRRAGRLVSERDKPAIPEWDYVPSGRLALTIDEGSHGDGLRRKFGDGKHHRLENLIDAVLVSAATIAAEKKAERIETERRRLEWAETERRRNEAERRHRLEEKRVEFLRVQADYFDMAREVDQFLADFTTRFPEDGVPETCQQFLAWARAYSEALKQAASPKRIAKILEEHRLMDDSTDIPSWIRFK